MVEDDVRTAGLQGIEHGFVKGRDVERTKVLVVEIVVVLGNPEEIELPRKVKTRERGCDRNRDVAVSGCVTLQLGRRFRNVLLNLNGLYGVNMAAAPNHVGKKTREISG